MSVAVHPEPETTGAAARDDAVPMRFSIVIANYNYDRFLGRAIESAVALDWPDVEVIVVDDGSTDNSREVIESFAGSITPIFQPNGGQRDANNNGFAHSTGEVIVFLDADDVLDPRFAKAVAAAWGPTVTKVQVQMQLIDAEDRPFGDLIPNFAFRPEPAQITAWARSATEYPTPPGSANAYSRRFLERFFPIGEEHDVVTDSTCLALAPLMGDVVTIVEPLVHYRQHGSNDSNLGIRPGNFTREVARAMKRQKSAEDICTALGVEPPRPDSLRRSRHLLQLRAASLRMAPRDHPLPGDGRITAGMDAIGSIFRRNFDPLKKRLIVAGWVLAVVTAPAPIARKLIRKRFVERFQNREAAATG
tara:strand:+ start:94931 stop:96016 length:1086 start_codon:yes stop_codon:yes gene_type:complete